MIQTFIYNPGDRDGDFIVLKQAEAHHAVKVLRLRRGDMIRLIDGGGEAHICEISSAELKRLNCRIVKTIRHGGEPALRLTLAIGLSAASKFDAVIEKGTEIGVSRFVPLLTEKGKIKIDSPANAAKKMNRWKRICIAAVKQSGRSIIPRIEHPISFTDFVNNCDPQTTILFHPGNKNLSMNLLKEFRDKKELCLIVGPESGFSPAELDLAGQKGIVPVSLGDRVLRTETAGTALPALIIYNLESFKA